MYCGSGSVWAGMAVTQKGDAGDAGVNLPHSDEKKDGATKGTAKPFHEQEGGAQRLRRIAREGVIVFGPDQKRESTERKGGGHSSLPRVKSRNERNCQRWRGLTRS